MYNYFGIGLDAKFCLGFDTLRKKYPNLFKSRVLNYNFSQEINLFILIWAQKIKYLEKD